jgi:hypothetical protein
MIRGWLALVLLTVSALPLCAISAELSPHDALYSLAKDGMVFGETRAQLKRNADNSYSYETASKATSLFKFFISDRIAEKTEWRWIDGILRPIAYYFDRRGGKKEKTIKLAFNWSVLKVKNDISGDVWSMSIEPGTYDKLSIYPDMMVGLRAGVKSFRYQVADGGKVKPYLFEVDGNETIETGIGKVDTIRVKRIHIRGTKKKKKTYIWFAPDRDYMPVRIDRTYNNDDLLRMEIKKYKTM